MHGLARFIGLGVSTLLLVACNNGTGPATVTTPTAVGSAPAAPANAPAATPAGNLLRMRIDGKDWIADHEIFGAVHPTGYDRSILMAGSLGPKDANEQAFNVILNGVDGPGTFRAKTGDAARHVAQIANLSQARYLAGGLMLEHDVTFEVTRMQASPVAIEARFSGTLTANDGAVLRIEDGEFSYRE